MKIFQLFFSSNVKIGLCILFYFFQFNDVITRNQAGCSFLHTSPDVVIQVATETKHTKPDKLTNLICNINMQDTYSTDSLVSVFPHTKNFRT